MRHLDLPRHAEVEWSDRADEELFRKIIAADTRLPDNLRHPSALTAAGPIAPFSGSWIRERQREHARGELELEDVDMLRAVERRVDRELYAACAFDAGGLAGWTIVNLESREVIYWRATRSTTV